MPAFFLVLLLIVCAPVNAFGKEPTPSQNVNAYMSKFHWHLRNIAPYLFSARDFVNEENDDIIATELQGLEETALQMEHKKVFENVGAAVMFDVLVRSLGDAAQLFENGNKEYARSLTRGAVGMCANCHTSGLSNKNFDFLMDQKFIDNLPNDSARIEVLLTTRQFEKAKKLSQDVINGYPANGAKYQDVDYALEELGVYYSRVNPSPTEAMQFFTKVSEKSALPVELKEDVNTWKKSFASWQRASKKAKEKGNPTLAEIRKSVGLTPDDSLLSFDSALTIPRMRALGDLHKLMASGKLKTPTELGEALHLLGLINAMFSRDFFTQIDDAYFAVCIETAPHSKTAVKCFQSLEENITQKSSGSSGTFMDVDDLRMLARYKRLAYPFQERQKKK